MKAARVKFGSPLAVVTEVALDFSYNITLKTRGLCAEYTNVLTIVYLAPTRRETLELYVRTTVGSSTSSWILVT